MGDRVLVRNHQDGPEWVPSTIVEVLGPVTYIVETDGKQRWKQHADHIASNAWTRRNFSPYDVSVIYARVCTGVYGNGDENDHSSLLVHEHDFVPLDIPSKYPKETSSHVHPCQKSLVFLPRRSLPPPYADNSQDIRIYTFSIFDHNYFLIRCMF